MSSRRPDYGIDSPGIVIGELALSGVAFAAAVALALLHAPRLLRVPLWGLCALAGGYLLLSAGSMLFYSKVGKRYIRDRMLSSIPWRGDEQVLDVGCGRGLLLVGAAQRLTTGKATGLDRWVRGAVTDNRPAAAQHNAVLAGVADRVELREGDARHLPFGDASFDVVVSNFVLHEMDTRAQREQMLQEIVRVLRPGGRLVLVDFIFTGEAVRVLRGGGMSIAQRRPVGWLYFVSSALGSLGLTQLFLVSGSKPTPASGTVDPPDA